MCNISRQISKETFLLAVLKFDPPDKISLGIKSRIFNLHKKTRSNYLGENTKIHKLPLAPWQYSELIRVPLEKKRGGNNLITDAKMHTFPW